jgi:hypothetical protein
MFNVASTLGESFTASMTGTTEDKTYSATIEYDGMGNGHYVGQFDEGSYELYILGERYVICSENQCIETPNFSDASPIDATAFEFSEEDLNSYRDSALYKGTETCPDGTCDVWEISIEEYSGKLYVTEDGRISKATGAAAGGTFEIVYTYEEVTITPPENIQTIPTT